MISNAISEFWNDFAANHWGKTPVVLRPPFDASLGTASEVFDAALKVGRRYPRMDEGPPRVHGFLGARKLHDASVVLPRAEDSSLDGFMRRMCASADGGDFALMALQFQATDDAIWARSTRFLSHLVTALGVPPGGAHLDLFILNQHRGFNGVHKDNQDVFTTVVAGKKRMLLWPFERFATIPGVDPTHRRQRHKLGQVCDDALRAEAIVLDAEPGDLMYWPADYWHISEAVGAPVATLGLGVVRTADPMRFVQAATSALVREQVTPAMPAPDVARVGVAGAMRWLDAATADALADHGYRSRLEDVFMRWSTRFGFEEVLPLAPDSELGDGDWLVGCGGHTFAHVKRHDVLAIAAHGYPLELPAHPLLVELCDRITRGAVFQVGAFIDVAANRAPAAHRPAIRAKLRALLKVLARSRAVSRVASPAIEISAAE